MARSVRFERKSSTHHVAFLEKAYVTGWGERRTRLEAVRAVREAEGWRVDRCSAVRGVWLPWEPVDTTPYPTLTAAKKALRAYAALEAA